jgi:hypothetical protein
MFGEISRKGESMTTFEKRLNKLEAVVNPKPLPPMILYCEGMTEAECAKFNKPPTPGNPLMLIVRPAPEEGEPCEP